MYPTLSESTKTNNQYCGKDNLHVSSESTWETVYGQGEMDNGTQK